MPNKYNEDDKKKVLDIYTCFDDIYTNDITDEWKKEYKGLDIKSDAWCVSGEGTTSYILDKQALISLGMRILKDSDTATVHYYKVSIPSTAVKDILHAVAFMIDHKNKIMRYHDSHGVDMRRECKDFLVKLFPDYKIIINYSKQQADVVSNNHQEGKNDNSCALLSLYNLRDMWFVQNGMLDKVCNFDSVSARQDAWKILSNIQKPQEQKETKLSGGTKFSFGKGTIKTEEEKLEYKKAIDKIADRAFKYRLYNEPNYDDLIKNAVDTVKEEIKKWHNEKIIHQNSGGRV